MHTDCEVMVEILDDTDTENNNFSLRKIQKFFSNLNGNVLIMENGATILHILPHDILMHVGLLVRQNIRDDGDEHLQKEENWAKKDLSFIQNIVFIIF